MGIFLVTIMSMPDATALCTIEESLLQQSSLDMELIDMIIAFYGKSEFIPVCKKDSYNIVYP